MNQMTFPFGHKIPNSSLGHGGSPITEFLGVSGEETFASLIKRLGENGLPPLLLSLK